MATIDTQNELSRCNSFVSSPSALSDNEIESCCHLYAAQTNSRLLHVLSDLVKAFLDTEQDIQESLEKMGFTYTNENNSNQLSSASRIIKGDFLPSLEDAIERLSSSAADTTFTENNDDIIEFTAPSENANALSANQSVNTINTNGPLTNVNNEDDILLGASRRLRSAVGKILHLLQQIVNTHQHQEKFILNKLQKEDKFGEDENEFDEEKLNNETYFNLNQQQYRDTEDLIAQIESSSRQISSFNKFIEQQTKEREFEHEEFVKEIDKYKEKLKEKEKLEMKLRDIIETHELQLQTLNEERNDFEKKFNEKSIELKRSMKVIDDYKQTIKQMEKESEELTTIENKLTKRIGELEHAITIQATINEQLHKEQLNNSNSLTNAVIESINLRTSQLQRTLNIGDMIDMDDYSASLMSEFTNENKENQNINLNDQTSSTQVNNLEKCNKLSTVTNSEIGEDDSPLECSYADVNILDEKMCLLNAYMEKLISQNIKLKSNLEYSNNRVEDLESQLNKFVNEKCTNENKIRDLQKQEELLREELNTKRLQITSLKTKIENNFDDNRNELNKLKENNEQLALNLTNEEKHNEQLRNQIQQLTILNDERTMKIEQLSDEIKSVSRSLSLFKNNIKRLEFDKTRLINNLNDLNKEKEKWVENEESLKKKINDLQAEIDNNKQSSPTATTSGSTTTTTTTTNVTMNYNEKYSPILLQLLQKIIKDKNEEINCLKQKVVFIESRLSQFLKEIRDKNTNENG